MEVNNPYQSPASPGLAVHADETYTPAMFSRQGRIGRLRYMAYSFGGAFVIMFAGGLFAGLFAALEAKALAMGAVGLAYLGMFVYSFFVVARRLNDMDRSGWLCLLMLVPLVNLLLWLVLSIAPGTATANRYGPRPSENTLGVWLGGLVLPVVMIGVMAAVAIPAYQSYVMKSQMMKMQQMERQP